MKIPAKIRACVVNNMPTWGKRFEKAKDVKELSAYDTKLRPAKLGHGSALGNYESCVVGEFYGFKKQAGGTGNPETYNGCTSCYEFSMAFHSAFNLKEFAEMFGKFCAHARAMHPQVFKK